MSTDDTARAFLPFRTAPAGPPAGYRGGMDAQGARRLGPQRLLVPLRAEGPGGLVGDALVEIGPEHPEFERWAAYLDAAERRATSSGSAPAGA